MITSIPRVLVIDDNPADVELIRIAFELLHCPIEMNHFNDGNVAVGLLQEQNIAGTLPALLLVDLNMPRLNGFEVLNLLQAQGLTEIMSAVVLSTSAQEKDRKRCLTLGAREMFTKPETVEEMQTLAKLLMLYLTPTVSEQS